MIDVTAAPYNAKGDGIADDTAALQAAFNDAAGKRVFLPAGTYLVTAPLTVSANYQPDIVGENTFGTVIKYAGTTPATAVLHRTSGHAANGGVTENLAIIGNANVQYGLLLDSATSLAEVLRVYFTGMVEAGLYVNSSVGGEFKSIMVNSTLGGPVPAWGIILDGPNGLQGQSGPNVISSPILELTTQGGLWLKNASKTKVSGAQISTTPCPLRCDTQDNSFESCLFENGCSVVNGIGNTFRNFEFSAPSPWSSPALTIGGSYNHFVNGCAAKSLLIQGGVVGTVIENIANLTPNGITDHGQRTHITRAF